MIQTIKMTEMMNKKNLLFLAGLLFSFSVSAQEADFGLWYELNADYKIIKGLKADFETSLRTDQKASNIESFYFEPGIRYKVNDYFSAGLYYRLEEQKEDDGKFYARHRWFVQAKGTLPVGRFTFSARYRVQQQFKTYIEKASDEIPTWYNRLRLEASFDVPSIPLEPYINTEAYSQLFSSNDIMIEKWRYIAGIQYTINKMHTFGIEYIYNTSKVTKPAYINIIGLKYAINL